MPQASSSSHPFKLIYLAPLFAILGLVSGATFSGMLYGRRTRRTLGRDAHDEFGELDMLADASPPSRSGRDELEEGYGHVEKEARASHADPRYLRPGVALNNSPQGHVHSVTSSPSEYGPTPTGVRLNDGIARPWYDRLPGLSAQVSTYQAAVPPLSPSWATADLVTPSSVANDGFASRDIRSHSSIRRAIADRLRVGTRRAGSRKESAQESFPDRSFLAVNTGTGDVAVRRASGQQYRENSSGTLQRRPQKGISSTLESQYRKVVEEFESETSPCQFTPGDDDHTIVEKETLEDDSVYIRLATSDTRVTSGSSVIAPKSSRSGSNAKLRVKSRKLVSPNDADHSAVSLDSDVLPKRKLRRRSDLTPASPTLSYEPDDEDAHPTLRLLSPPPRVISPPAHPELFFADPVLGEYVENTPLQLHRDKGRARGHSAGSNADIDGGRHYAQLHPQKPPAYSDDLSGTVSDNNGDGDGTKSTAESERTSASVSTASAFYGLPMKPARTHEALGAVNAIMKTGWSVREDLKSAEQAEHRRKTMRQLSGAGLGNPPRGGTEAEEIDAQMRRQGWREASHDLPSITTSAAQRSGIVGERIRQLQERGDAAL